MCSKKNEQLEFSQYENEKDLLTINLTLKKLVDKIKELFKQEAKLILSLQNDLPINFAPDLIDNFQKSIEDLESIKTAVDNRRIERKFNRRYFTGTDERRWYSPTDEI